MANTIALRKQYSTLLDEVYKLSSLTAVLDGPNELVKEGANANEILIPKLSMQGLADYNKSTGYVPGDVTLDYETNAIPQVAAKAPVIIGKLASTIITNLPKIIQTGVKIITQLAVGLVQGIPALLGKIPSMISQIKNAFTSVNWGSVGMNIISGIASGISSAVGSLISAATSAASSALDAIKSKLGIHSPSRVFRDQVGKMMALGMGIGFEKNIPVGSMNAGVQKAVQSLQRSVQLTTSVNSDKTVGGIKNNPIFKDQGFDYDRFERIQRKIAKENGNKPVFLDTKRIDRPLPKGAVPQV